MKKESTQLSPLDRALIAIDKMQAKLAGVEKARTEPIAIVGMACRFPGGGSDPASFWRALRNGVDAVRKIPMDRWPADAIPDGHPGTRWAAMLDNVDSFDAPFFGIAPREATSLDPQQRLLLEVAWEALEDAGQIPARWMGSQTGVFLGISSLDYQQRVVASPPASMDAYWTTGNLLSTAAGRLSYFLDLEGPCLSVDTACSSSLVAVHLACHSLRSGESSMALVGGVNLLLSPLGMNILAHTQALSPDGRCRTFDAGANGFVRGEGAGMVVLKRLSDAERDGDRIWALIRGSAVNQDGRSTGLTAPNVLSQQALLRRAFEQARVDPADVGYIEAHGTGTPLGDPIEVEALKEIFGKPRADGLACALGSVKTNIGHLEAAAGIAGLIKATLAVANGWIPRHLHFQALNPRISLEETPLVIAAEERAFPAHDKSRVAAVSSFGLSGTNAHAILQEAPKTAPPAEEGDACAVVLPLSAKNRDALLAAAEHYSQFLAAGGTASLGDIAFTASVRRAHHAHRLAVVGRSRGELAETLAEFARGEPSKNLTSGRADPEADQRVVFVFSGQGSQWAGMGRRLLEEEPAFRAAIEQCDALMKPLTGWSLLAELSAPEGASRLGETHVAQTAIFAVQWGLAEVFRSWGVVPDAVVGHSIGEIAAACVIGVLALKDAVELVCARGKIMNKATGLGKMAVVSLSEEEAARAIVGREDRLSIAAINDPGSVVLSGNAAALAEVLGELEQRGVHAQMLRGDYAFHSPQMAALAGELGQAFRRIVPQKPERALYSTVKGALASEPLDAAYWVENVRAPVRLSAAIAAALADGYRLFVEIGPHAVLTANVEACVQAQQPDARAVPTLRRNQDERQCLLLGLGALHVHGYPVDWSRIYPKGGRVVSLPVYPWQRQRYWMELPSGTARVASNGPTVAGHVYDSMSEMSVYDSLDENEEAYLTFGPLREIVPGFSWLDTQLLTGDRRTEHTRLVLEAQREMRKVLFRHVEFAACHRALDFGCGYATDLIVLAKKHPHLRLDGYTISEQQASIDRERVARAKLAERVAVHHRDSAKDDFPGVYDLVFGFEVAHHIRDKQALFSNISRHLVEGGALVLADFISNVDFEIEHEETSSFFLMKEQWIDVLSENAIELIDIVDISQEVANFLHDQDFDEKLTSRQDRGLDKYTRAALKSYDQLGKMLRRGLASYVLIAARKSSARSIEELKGRNRRPLSALLSFETASPRAPREPGEEWLLSLQWQRKDPREEAQGSPSPRGGFFVLADRGGTGADLAREIQGRGYTCVVGLAGERFERIEDRLYRLDPFDPQGFRAVLRDAFSEDAPCLGIVHLWNLDAQGAQQTTIEGLLADLGLGCQSALPLAQAVARANLRDVPRVWFVTRGVFALRGDSGPVSVAQAPVWGFGRTLAIEHPEMQNTQVDLSPARPAGEASVLFREIERPDQEDQIALRPEARYVARLVRASFAASQASIIRADAAYLITGGLGGLGLEAARWLVERGARHVALLGRREPSDAAQDSIRALREAGADVLVMSCDVSRRDDLAGALGAIREKMPNLRGILHAAGVIDDKTVLELSQDHFRRVFLPKVSGAWNLHELTRGIELDFFVMYSSAAALLGSAGQGNYAAANAFMDALAHLRRAEGAPAMSVQWGAFSDVGMAAQGRGRRKAERGLTALSPAEGAMVLGRLLDGPPAQIGVMKLDLRQWLEFHPHAVRSPLWTELLKGIDRRKPKGSRAEALLQALRAARPEDRLGLLEKHVGEQVGRVLGLPPGQIDRRASFTSLGMDSLMALEVRNLLERSLELKLASTLMFTYPNVGALAEALLEKSDLRAAPEAEKAEATVAAPTLVASLDTASPLGPEPIAIVGLACRFPGGGSDPEAFWGALRRGVDAVGRIPPERWPTDAIPDDHPGTRWAAMLDSVDQFDAFFFGIAPREAISLDPQQRLLLEIAWEALEDAGQVPERLIGSATGVFLGISSLDYQQRVVLAEPEQLDAYWTTGNMLSTAAGRLSYFLGVEGPCMSIDTACSSSLVAVHLACQSLRNGESNLAMAAGVNLVLSPTTMHVLAQTQALSPDGRCKAFDASANGFARGEGAGLVVLKRLRDALRDGDRIRAIIRGSAVNQDGHSTGLTAPNVLSQEALLRQALRQARVEPREIGYIEAHGTGTSLGDPIELEALKEVIGAPRPDGSVCPIGAVKTNLGHLEAAAGVAGLIKTVLILEHGIIPRNLHFHVLNPRISLEDTSLVIASEERAFPRAGEPRVAGVSSFGISGTNSHVILQEAPEAPAAAPVRDDRGEILPLSAKTPEALAALAEAYALFLGREGGDPLADIAYTASARRSQHDHRLAVVGRSKSEIADILAMYGRGEHPAGIALGQAVDSPLGVTFVFSGQGSQWAGMGMALFDEEPVFRAMIERCDELMKRHAGLSLIDELRAPEGESRLRQTAVAQPAIFAVQVGLCELFQSWGLRPDAVIGHSVGEIAAAYVAGALTLEEAARVVCHRGRVMQRVTGQGKMAAVALSAEEAALALAGYEASVAIAAVNDPGSVVLSGEAAALAEILARMTARGVRSRALPVDYAFHSPQMEPLLEELAAALGEVSTAGARLPIYSTVTGARLDPEPLGAAYWAKNMRQAVQFNAAAQAALADGQRAFIEIGPHPVLSTNLEACLRVAGGRGIALPTLRRGQAERPALLGALASLYAEGRSFEWRRLFGEGRRVVALPPYAWQRHRYWLDAKATPRSLGDAVETGHPLLGAQLPIAGPGAVFEKALSVEGARYLSHHRVFDQVIVPGTALVEIAHAAAMAHLGAVNVCVSGLVLQAPLMLPEAGGARMQVALGEPTAAGHSLAIYSQAADAKPPSWTLVAQGYVHPEEDTGARERVDLAALKARCRDRVDVDERYAAFGAAGVSYGPAFHCLKELWQGRDEALSRLRLPSDAGDAEPYSLHPVLLDGALQTASATRAAAERAAVYLPFEVTSYRSWRAGLEEAFVHARRTDAGATDVASFDIHLMDDEGNLVAELSGVRLKRSTAAALERSTSALPSDWLVELAWKPAEIGEERALEQGAWLIVSEDADAASALANRMRRSGAGDVSVADLKALESIQGLPSPLRGVVCLWASAPEASPADAAESLAVAGLRVLQALAKRACSARLFWVTRGAQAALPGESASLEQAPLWGLGRVIMQEHPDLRCTLVDLTLAPKDTSEMVWRELCRADDENQVALRGERRLVARLVKAAPCAAERRPLVVPESTVLITGGLGALGLRVARWLCEEHHVRHLILASRRAPADGERAEIEALRATGAEITVARADVARREDVEALVASIPAEWPLRGVVHAAGVLDDGVLLQQTAARFAAVLAPKVRGALHLEELTRGSTLDFFALFSSAASLVGSAGQGNYAAGNALLDALAYKMRAEGRTAHAIDWGAWSETGMAAALDASQRARLQRQGVGVISPAQGVAFLGQILTRPEAQIGVLPLETQALHRALSPNGEDVPPLFRALLPARPARAAERTRAGWAARLSALSPAARAREVESAVRADLARVLSLSPGFEVRASRPLQELGVDSLMAVELRNALAGRVGKPLPATLVFDYPTLDAIVRHLLDDVLIAERSEAPVVAPRAALENEPIAIVGLGCRYPGNVVDAESFWRLLEQGVDAIREIPPDRWDVDALYDPDPDASGKMITRYGGFLDDIDRFDPTFFGITPREAVKMDPQQRLLLETTWEALESAGLLPSHLQGSDAGVFVGLMYHEYASLAGGGVLHDLDGYVGTGNAGSVASGRISYLFGLKGPSLTVDTACSSSLVAIHLACQSLRQGECSLALAGGVALMLTPVVHVEFSRLRGIAPDGRCKSFDAAADGVAWSEGCGVVVLKRLSDARRDGDPILAVIRGSAVNQDGRSNGLTAPNGPSQEVVIRRALEQAAVLPAAIAYVEAHGTGTPLGDTIEAQALGRVLGQGRAADHPLIVGSIKSNIGHTNAAAGVAGVIKAVLSLQHGVIPPSLHFREPNPRIPWAELPITVAARATAWPSNGSPRLAGVSSFGISGTNAHIVLEEAPVKSARVALATHDVDVILPLSAKSPEALAAMARRFAEFLAVHASEPLYDIAFTASARRDHHAFRLSAVGASPEALAEALSAFARGERPAGLSAGQADLGAPPRLVFVFPGQGSQWLGMGKALLAEEPAFRKALEECDAALRRETGWSLIEELSAEEQGSRLDQIDVVQPVLFAIEVALSALWRSWGVEPDGVIGHSMGEVAAAHVAGALSLGDAARVICRRSRLLRRVSGQGAMVLVELPLEEAEGAIAGYEDRVSVAVSNSPRSTVLSGDPGAVDAILGALSEKGVFCRRVKVDVASHSPQMDPLLGDLLAALEGLAPSAARIPMHSTVTGQPLDGLELSPHYWARNLREPVLFGDTIARLLSDRPTIFIEVSPHPILVPSIEEASQRTAHPGVALGSLRRDQPERRMLLEALGAVYVHGALVDWQRVYPAGRTRSSLPSYPWQRERYWISDERRVLSWSDAAAPARAGGSERLLGASFSSSRHPEDHLWERPLSLAAFPFLGDYRVAGEVVLSVGGYLELALAAAAEVFSGADVEIRDLAIERILSVPEDGTRIAQVVLSEEGLDSASLHIASRIEGEASWLTHATGQARHAGASPVQTGAEVPPRERIRGRLESLSIDGCRDRAASSGVDHGAAFQGLVAVWSGEGEVLGEVQIPDGVDSVGYCMHPALFDPCVLAAEGLFESAVRDKKAAYVPARVARVRVHRLPGRRAWFLAKPAAVPTEAERVFDLWLLDDEGRLLVDIQGLVLRPLPPAMVAPRSAPEPARAAKGQLRRKLMQAALADRGALLLRALLAHVARVLRLDAARLDPNAPLLSLGMDSLMALELRNAIERDLGVKFPASELLQSPSARAVSARLLERLQGAPAPALPSNGRKEAEPSKAWTPLVPIQTAGAGRPFFIVHALIGTALPYVPLGARLGGNRPVYGLQGRGLFDDEPPVDSMDEMAALYIRAIREVQPEGPYLIGGWSFGGFVAMRMARKLIDAGQEVGLLAIFDSMAPSIWGPAARNDAASVLIALAQAMGMELEANAYSELESAERLTKLCALLSDRGLWSTDIEPRRLAAHIDANIVAGRGFLPEVPCAMTYFRAMERSDALFPGIGFPDMGAEWRACSSYPVEVIEVPGTHFTMMIEPQVDVVATALGRRLLAADGPGRLPIETPKKTEEPLAKKEVQQTAEAK